MFGGRFKLTGDPSLAAERSDRRSVEGGWLTRIPCGNGGFIAPQVAGGCWPTTPKMAVFAPMPSASVSTDDDREAGTA